MSMCRPESEVVRLEGPQATEEMTDVRKPHPVGSDLLGSEMMVTWNHLFGKKKKIHETLSHVLGIFYECLLIFMAS